MTKRGILMTKSFNLSNDKELPDLRMGHQNSLALRHGR